MKTRRLKGYTITGPYKRSGARYQICRGRRVCGWAVTARGAETTVRLLARAFPAGIAGAGKSATAARLITLQVTRDERQMLFEGLDSRMYELADEHYRNNGAIVEPFSDDDETALKIDMLRLLQAKIEQA